MEVARRFGENLRRLRRGADISQEELGLRCSLHRTEIGLLERGARVPRIDTLIKIASGLGVGIDCKLLDGISWTLPRLKRAGSRSYPNPGGAYPRIARAAMRIPDG